MIKIGNSDVSGIYLGGTPISEIYVGGTKVWPAVTLPLNNVWVDGSEGFGYWERIKSGGGAVVKLDVYYEMAQTTLDTGETWEAAVSLPVGAGGEYQALEYVNGNFVAVAEDFGVYSGNGGLAWSVSNLGAGPWTMLAVGGDTIIAFAAGTNQAARSTNGGVSWTPITLPASGDWVSPVYAKGNFVVFSADSTLALVSDDDGVTWTAVTLPRSGEWTSAVVSPAGTILVAPRYSDEAVYSTDGGLTWQTSTLPTQTYWTLAGYSKGNLILASWSSGTGAVVWSDDEGATWHDASHGVGAAFIHMAASDDRIIIDDGGDQVMSSEDGGKTWIPQTRTNDDWRGLAVVDNVFIAMATGGGGVTRLPKVRGMNMAKVCLNMVIKNEAHVIERCLRSAVPLIDSWCIVDTGSTDGTQDIVRNFLRDIPGVLHEQPWVNMGGNRTSAFQMVSGADYVLLIDADEVFEAPDGFEWPKLTLPAYELWTRYGNLRYTRAVLLSARHNWRWVGVNHPYPDCGERVQVGQLDQPVQFARHEGARSLDHTTYLRDAERLQGQLEQNPDDPRTVFYLAQSWRDATEYGKARDLYRQRVRMGGWMEERWHAAYQAARMTDLLGGDPTTEYLAAFDMRPTRAEPLVRLASWLRRRKRYDQAALFAQAASELPMPKDRLFVEVDAYEWRALDELAVAGYYAKASSLRDAGRRASVELLSRETPDRTRIESNHRFYLSEFVG